jgi:hypothetical protein
VGKIRSQVLDLPNIVGLLGDGRHSFESPGVVPDPVVAICPESFKDVAALIHRRRLLLTHRDILPRCPSVGGCSRSVAAGQREAAPTFLGIRTSRTPVTSSHTSQAA